MVEKERLSSLDILRGLVLFLLVFFQPLLWSVGGMVDTPWMDRILYQFNHEIWEGFRLWDMVMPMFLFMSGVTVPFSLEKYKSHKKDAYIKILRRVIILWVLGMVVQGNLLGLQPKYFRFYSNTLQAIAAGYLITSILYLNCNVKWQIIATVSLLLLYWAPVTFLGDFTPEGNFAIKVDRAVLGRFMDGVYWNQDGTWSFSSQYHYSWILSSLTFGVTVMLGSFAGQIIKKGQDKNRNALLLLATGTGLVVLGLLWSLQMPIIKRIWTSSMALFAGGISFLILAVFYFTIDCKKKSKGLGWLKIYGMNSITAYVLGEAVNFRSIVASLSYGLERYIGDWYAVWLCFGNYLIVFLILFTMYRNKLFIKI